jgi:dsRNA-specific ribonuclease
MDEVSFVDRLAKVAFQVDPEFEYVEEEITNPHLRFTATLSLGEKFRSLTKGIGPNKKSAKE